MSLPGVRSGARWPTLLLALLAVATSLRADTLVTLDGRDLEGSLRFEGEQVLFTPRVGSPLRLPLSEVVQAETGGQSTDSPWSGLLLADGSRVRVRDFVSSDGRTLRFRSGDGVERTISLGIIAMLVFAEQGTPAASPAEPGAILASGDFFAGELVSIRDNQVTVSSVLFGLRRFRLGNEARAIWLRPSRPLHAARVLALADGSLLDATAAVIRDGRLSLDHPVAGRLALQPKDVRSLRLGGQRVLPLHSLLPAVATSVAVFPAYRLDVTSAPPRIEQRLGTTLSFDLPDGMQAFLVEVSAAPGTLPLTNLRFVVLVDGRPVLRSVPTSPLDGPRRLAASISGGRRLTLLVESEPPIDLPLRGLWIGPVLVRE